VTLTSAGAAANAAPSGSPYPIIPSAAEGAGLANYTIAYLNGALTIFAATPPVLQSAKISGGFLSFTGSASVNQNYRIQSTTDLADTNWPDLGGLITATNSTMSAAEPITNSWQFYRLVLSP